MKQVLLAFIILFTTNILHAQVYMEEKSKHRFAQTYVGFNTQIVPTQGQFVSGGLSSKFPTLISPRFNIGGLHFWGKWDFNVNLPLAHLGDKKVSEDTEYHFIPGADLSARYYPWRMEFGKLRPYAGVSVNQMVFKLDHEELGSRDDLFFTASPLAGVSYAYKGWQLNAELMWVPTNKKEFYTSRNQREIFHLPQNYFSVGIVKFFDTTLKEEKGYKNGSTKKKEDELRSKGKLNSFSIGVAPSGAYFLRAPQFSQGEQQSLPRHKGEFNWDFGLGYLFHDTGLHIGFSYRDYSSNSNSYGLEHVIRRKSVAFEAFKFFWDYNGFVPFIGPSISYERWGAAEFENDVMTNEVARTRMISPGIIFGWDIVPSPLETWVLRTNLRYYPLQKVKDPSRQLSRMDQFEFNIIQLVIYPNRIINLR
ncbi:hypothetical protein QYS48_34265 [Marivirga arenosa]|uniref:Uncharacterized protein n=1 Tax=Marivirga arenosa TaxID=3059076 RepID=A0AA51RCT9_9BACT|nr:hypothetical protein [Marivirga sp. ABR2-2]WMN06919.1 hypothetical protein QYS48_34265 [Marivirga sp. ABR2-2]